MEEQTQDSNGNSRTGLAAFVTLLVAGNVIYALNTGKTPVTVENTAVVSEEIYYNKNPKTKRDSLGINNVRVKGVYDPISFPAATTAIPQGPVSVRFHEQFSFYRNRRNIGDTIYSAVINR